MHMILELCSQSYADAKLAEKYKIPRIELNSALELGGLSPQLATLQTIKRNCNIQVIAMLRLRGGDFCYSQSEMQELITTAHLLLQNGADGLAFGANTANGGIEQTQTKQIVNICKEYGKEFVFHRAFDVQNNIEEIEILIALGANRLLTSGMCKTAWEGRENLRQMQTRYGKHIEILAGSGVNAGNAKQILNYTGVEQIHGSFSIACESKSQNEVSFGSYLTCNEAKLQALQKELMW